jgi:8-oxo-dGTP diphosphatase
MRFRQKIQTVPRKNNIDTKSLNVVALVLENHQGEILLAKRAKHKHLGGLWEFPGGKVEVGETQLQALIRETKEEIDFDLTTAIPLITTTHSYDSFTLTLDVWYHQASHPNIHANENQPLQWVKKSELRKQNMPEADQPIIEAIIQHST